MKKKEIDDNLILNIFSSQAFYYLVKEDLVCFIKKENKWNKFSLLFFPWQDMEVKFYVKSLINLFYKKNWMRF